MTSSRGWENGRCRSRICPASWKAHISTPSGCSSAGAWATASISAARRSFSSSKRTSRLSGKCRKNVRWLTPARAAISAVVVWSNPRSRYSSSAACCRRRRVSAPLRGTRRDYPTLPPSALFAPLNGPTLVVSVTGATSAVHRGAASTDKPCQERKRRS